MRFILKLLGINRNSNHETDLKQNLKPEKENKSRGFIRFVFMVASLPVQPTKEHMIDFIFKRLPELYKQNDNTAKLGFFWETKPINEVDEIDLAVKAFGKEIMDPIKYTNRTLHYKITGGEAKIFIIYDATSN